MKGLQIFAAACAIGASMVTVHAQQDAQAVKALQQWTFKPGQKDGKDVAVNLDFRINFTLQ